MKCYSCESDVEEGDVYRGDGGTCYEDKPLCETCYYEDEPNTTIFYGSGEEPKIISDARNETGGEFTTEWVSTDPWRGYYKTRSDDYSLVNTAELLSYHESGEMLEKFDRKIRKAFDDYNIDYARAFSRSSNVFYQNYDLYVRNKDALIASLAVEKAKQAVGYNDPKYRRNILFDEDALGKMSELFPEEGIQTDNDALKVVEKYGDGIVGEIQKRLK